MKVCSYCKQPNKLTDEHVYSDSVLRLFDDLAPITIDPIREKLYTKDPVLKDLCGTCNSALSKCDVYMKSFASTYLLNEIRRSTNIEFHEDLFALWCIKTASNNERSANPKGLNPWWHKYRDYFRGLNKKPDTGDILFAAWKNIEPLPGMNPVNVIESKELIFVSDLLQSSDDWKKLVERSWCIKIGYGVFCFIDWKSDASVELRNNMLKELISWGWLIPKGKQTVLSHPFNIVTSATYFILSDPNDKEAYKRLRKGNS